MILPRLSTAQRALLARRLHRADRAIAPRAKGQNRLLLPHVLRRIWFLAQMAEDSPAYLIVRAFRIGGPLDVGALRAALAALAARHEMLRARFGQTDGEPWLEIAETAALSLETTDLSTLPEGGRLAEAERQMAAVASRPFAIADRPPWRVHLWTLERNDHIVALVLHHLICDGWSVGVLHRDLERLYREARGDTPLSAVRQRIDYGDYIQWHERQQEQAGIAHSLEYWSNRLAGLPVLELPTDRPRPALQRMIGRSYTCVTPPALTDALRRLATFQGTSLFIVLLAAFQVLLHRWSGQRDFGVGVPIANRPRPELENIVGMFSNTLVMRTDLGGDLSARTVIARLAEWVHAAFEHSNAPFDLLVERLGITRDVSRAPVYQAMFNLLNGPDQSLTLPDTTVEALDLHNGGAQVDLTVVVRPDAAGYRWQWIYDSTLFDADTIAAMAKRLVLLLEAITDDPDQPIAVLPFLLPAERRLVLDRWSASAPSEPGPLLVERLIASAGRWPRAVAVACGDEAVTYEDLLHKAHALAGRLRREGVGAGDAVGLCLERNTDLVVALLGIMIAGAAYLPLDPAFPPARLALMIEDAQPAIVLCQDETAGLLPAGVRRAGLAGLAQERPLAVAARPPLAAADTVYLLFTSGSTGRPKGVAVSHGALAALLRAVEPLVPLGPGDVLPALATLSFDIAALELFLPLLHGATVEMVPSALAGDGPALAALLRRCGATVLQATPGSWRMLLETGQPLPPLRAVSTGESLPRPLAERLAVRFGAVLNLYGPTETTIYATAYRYTAAAADGSDGAVVAIGRPLAGYRIYLLDEALQPVPPGLPGEIFIGGVGVADGYLKQPELTAARFLADPFMPGGRMYRTGDLGRFGRDGVLMYLGRIDHQVKLRGFRIEPGEIEALLERHPQVRQAAVAVRPLAGGEPGLVAYVVPVAAAEPGILMPYLGASLPDYMIPQRLVGLDVLPMTTSGKTDRQALPAPARQAPSLRVAPCTPMERLIVAQWQDLFGVPEIGVEDNFFDLGGHSLLAARFVIRLLNVHGIALPVRQVFAMPRAATLAAYLDTITGGPTTRWTPEVGGGSGNASEHVVVLRPGGDTPLVFAPSLPGESYYAEAFVEDLPKGLAVWGLLAEQEFESVAALAAHCVAALRRVRPQGPYRLAGYSFGGLVAFEMARQLCESGQHVDRLAVIDTTPGFVMFPFDSDNVPSEKLRHHNWQLHRRHIPGPYAGRLLYVRTRKCAESNFFYGLDGGWRDLAEAVDIREVSGGHSDVLAPQQAREVAVVLGDDLEPDQRSVVGELPPPGAALRRESLSHALAGAPDRQFACLLEAIRGDIRQPPWVLFNLAMLAARLGRQADLPAITRMCRDHAPSAAYCYAAMIVAATHGDFAAARWRGEQALARGPVPRLVYRDLCNLCLGSGHPAEASRVLDRARNERSEDTGLHALLEERIAKAARHPRGLALRTAL